MIAAWLVIDSLGRRAVFLDKPKADEYAARTHGTVHPLYTAEP